MRVSNPRSRSSRSFFRTREEEEHDAEDRDRERGGGEQDERPVAEVLVGDEAELVEVGENAGFELLFIIRVAGDGAGDGGDIDRLPKVRS